MPNMGLVFRDRDTFVAPSSEAFVIRYCHRGSSSQIGENTTSHHNVDHDISPLIPTYLPIAGTSMSEISRIYVLHVLMRITSVYFGSCKHIIT